MQQSAQRGASAMKSTFSKPKFWQAIRMSLFNQICVSLPYGCVVAYFELLPIPSSPTETPPSFFTFIGHMVFILLVEEFGFYYSHRWLHTPFMYQHVHKAHHDFVSPFGASSIACHWFEHILANVSPVLLGPILLQSHPLIYFTWLGIGIMDVVLIGHSGYHFPFLPSGEKHDWHHLRRDECFGPLGLLDAFHGTDRKFHKSMQGRRNHVITSVAEFQRESVEKRDD
jgi:sterol desaturase/sphingolipid hydroxylase (fatty acid hydroxylase superfamily)